MAVKILLSSLLLSTLPVLAVSTNPVAQAASGDAGSIQFNEPRSNYLTIDSVNSAFAFGTSDFTIEFWWKPTTSRRSDTLDFYNLANTNMPRLDLGSNIVTGGIELYTDSGCSIDSGVSLSSVLNTWTHIALTRSAGSLFLWINGVQKGTISCNKDFGSAGYALSIMKDHGAGANGSGSLSNIRVVRGSALYTNTFAPPVSQLTNVTGTSFLMNTVQGSNYLQDSSANNVTVTAVNSPVSSTSIPTLGSVCFDNSTIASYIDLTDANNAVGTSDFTLEMWMKIPANTGTMTVINGHPSVNGGSTYNLFTDGVPANGAPSNGYLGFSSPVVQTRHGSTPANQWFHFAYVRSNGSGRIYFNGVPSTYSGNTSLSSATDTNNYSLSTFKLGYPLTGTWPGGFTGCLAGIALTKSALYTGDFSAHLPYPGTRALPSNSIIFLKPTADGFTNAGSGGTPSVTGSVTYNSDLPSQPITIASASITGAAVYGQTLTAVPGTIANASSPTISYQWFRGGVAISGSTSSTYTLTTSDIGAVISTTITASSGGVSASATSPGTVSVVKAGQIITFTSAAPTNAVYGGPTYTPTATGGSSGNPVTFSIDGISSGVCSISGGVITMTGAGSCKVNANQAGSTNYLAASATSQVFTVAKVVPSITLAATSPNINLGQSDTLTATTVSGATGTITFRDSGGNLLCVTGAIDASGIGQCSWTPAAGATYSVVATYSGDGNYETKTSSVSVSVTVNSIISFDLNGGVGTVPSAWISPATSTTLPLGNGINKSGYTFNGWSTTNGGAILPSTYSSTISQTLYAKWSATAYTITYNANGGSGSQTPDSFTTGSTPTTLVSNSTFTRTGYTFAGWAASPTSTTPITSYNTSAVTTFYAIWTHGTYTVTFAENSGSGVMAPQTSAAAANLNANTFIYSNHAFLGWNTSADGSGTQYSNSANYPFLASITLYAQWGKIITFTSQGASVGLPSMTTQSWTSGSINLPTVGTMVRDGYTFSGWSDGSQSYPAGGSYTPTDGITLNPIWVANTYSISYNSNLAATGLAPSNQSWIYGTPAWVLSGNPGSLTKPGYTFGGWAASVGSKVATTTYSLAGDKVFYAVWVPISYTVTYALNGGTSAVPTQLPQNIYNSFTLASKPTRANYNFAGWSDGISIYGALATYSITAASPSNITLTSQWTPIYTLNYVLNGSISSITGSGSYDSGTVVTLMASPTRLGYTFNNWLDGNNVSHAAGTSFTIVEDSVLQAQWSAILYPVTYDLNGASGTIPLQSSLTLNTPFTISSTAPSRAGYTFIGWSDGTSIYPAGSTYVMGVNAVALTAQWSANSYSATFDLGGGHGALPAAINGLTGSTFTLPDSSANPMWIAHAFTGWSDGTSIYPAGATLTFGATSLTFTAQYSRNGYTQITYSFGSNGSGVLPSQRSALEGESIVIASGSGLTRLNYAFAGWSDGSNLYQPGDNYLVGPEANPVIFVPNWTSGYNVTYSSGSGFGVAPIDSVGRIAGSTFIVASAATLSRQGFTFTGWSDGISIVDPGSTYTVPANNVSLTAQWVQNSLAGIAPGSLVSLANFSIINGVSPTGSFNFGSTTITYSIPVNALSAGTSISIYGLSDYSSFTGIIPTGMSVLSSTVISWLGTDGTVADTSSPITMTIINSGIVPGTIVYAISGSSLIEIGTASVSGSITTTITSDPVLVLANPVVAPISSAPIATAADNSASIAAIQAQAAAEKAAAEKAAAEKAAAEKAAQDAAAKVAADQLNAEAALKAAQDKMAADAKTLADAKAAQDAAALKAAQDAAEASARAAAVLQAAKDVAVAAAKAAASIKPAVTLYSLSAKLTLNAYNSAYLQKYANSLKSGSSVTCVGYVYRKNTTLVKATTLAKSQANAVCTLMRKNNKSLKTSVRLLDSSQAPKAARGANWVAVSYRIDGFKLP